MTTATISLPTPSMAPAPHFVSTDDASARLRSVEGIYRAPGLHWVGDGFRVAGYFSAIPNAARKLSPFLLLDYHPTYEYAPLAARQRPRGVGVHPHRGFETVTVAFQGSVAHHDSAGGGGVIGPGDAQWMTAGSGVLHKEYHERSFAERGGAFQMAQLWVNLPRKHKMTEPRYQGLVDAQMGRVRLADNAGSVRIIAGEYRGVRGPALTKSPVGLFHVKLSAGGRADFAFPRAYNAGILVMGGDLAVSDRDASTHDFIVLAHDGERVSLEARTDAELLLMAGEPIDEPIVQYGPFVMNTEREIDEAIADFQRGKFGELDD
ncbi:MAG: pirin family protein [Polyangiaceae bacterium]